MKVKVRLLTTSQPIVFENVENTYTKDGFFCVYLKEENKVFKYPAINIFNVEEDYK
jgi:hypothetical protein